MAGRADDPLVRSGWRTGLGVSSLAAAVLIGLIFVPAAAPGGQLPESSTNTTGAPVTLTITIVGEGTVVSSPAGISCGSTCSAQFPDGTFVTLDPIPADGFFFGSPGFSTTPPFGCYPYDIHDPVVCGITLDASLGTTASVQATFFPYSAPPPCTVPNVVGRPLAGAESRITQHHCSVGEVKHAFSRKVRRGRVISQSPPASWQREQGAPVNLVVSKGRRGSRHGRT
jgi:hypothetical protein